MININYVCDRNVKNEKCDVGFHDDATFIEVLYGFIKVCEFAGYSACNFDYIIDGMKDGESFKDYVVDCVDELIC